MSWSISATGTKAEVVEKITALKPYEQDTPENKDQFEAAKTFLLSELEKSSDKYKWNGPEKDKIFAVACNGHADSGGNRTFGLSFQFTMP